MCPIASLLIFFMSIKEVFRKNMYFNQMLASQFWGVTSRILGRHFRLLGRGLTVFGARLTQVLLNQNSSILVFWGVAPS
jgi:hypothetical protein